MYRPISKVSYNKTYELFFHHWYIYAHTEPIIRSELYQFVHIFLINMPPCAKTNCIQAFELLYIANFLMNPAFCKN